MRRRVIFAAVSAVMLAVVTLGVPLTIYAARFIRDDAQSDLDGRAATIVRVLEARWSNGERIDELTLGNYVGGEASLPAYIHVTLPDGTEIEAGEQSGRWLTSHRISESGLVVDIYVSWWDVFQDALSAIALILGAAVIAVAGGVAVAVWQANRLSRPLVYLAASAEQLGSGQSRPSIWESGVEEIDMVAQELVRSGERMAARLASERQFSSDASHQLRTPLTALTMRLEEISGATDRADVRAEAEAALEQVERLVGVVDDLLGRSRKALGGSTELMNVGDVLRQQREEWTAPFEKAGRELVVADTEVRAFATPGGLAQVLATLIENSLHHGGGTTRVAVRESGSNYAVVIEVADEGAGVPDALAPRIFEREVTSGKGTGLGLALARDLVTADGGRLELSQRVPAVFSVFLQGVPPMVDPEDLVSHTRKIKKARRRP